MFYETIANKHGLKHDPFKAIVGPRPIGWISTISRDGICNIGPYSFFNAVGEKPHYVMFSSSGRKDSIRNVEETGEFTCSLSTWDLRDNMNMTSASVPYGVDEFPIGDLTAVPGRLVKAPRVKESPAALECKFWKTVELPPLHPGGETTELGGVRAGGRRLHRRPLRQGRHGRYRRHAADRPPRLHGLCRGDARDDVRHRPPLGR